MTPSPRTLVRALLFVLSFSAIGMWAYKLHLAGCMADLKGGTWGDAVLALKFESQAFALGLAGSGLFGLASIGSAEPDSLSSRVFVFLASGGLCLVALLAIGFILGMQGSTPCA